MLEAIIFILLIIGVVWFMVAKAAGSAPKTAQAPADISMLPEKFIVFDLETTGLDPSRHEIIEIGAIKVDRDGSEHVTFSTLVMPQGRISSKITAITGIDRAMVKADGASLREAIDAFRDFVEDLPMVAFNADFDRKFLSAACLSLDAPPFANRVDCALKLSRKAWPGRTSYRLTDICRDAGVKVVSEHRALPDCERAMRVYAAAASKLGRV